MTGRAERARAAAIALLLGLGVGAITVAAWSLAVGGQGWDARIDTQAALVVRSIDSSWTLPAAYEAVPLNSEFYGVFVQQVADVLHRLTTGSAAPLQAEDPTTTIYQGAVSIFLSVASVGALAVAIAVAFRSWLAGAFAWALTLSTPLWLGLSHVDFKDVPLAAGLSLVTAGLVLAFSLRPGRRTWLAGVPLAGAGGALVLATRPGSLVLLAVLAGTTSAVVLAWAIARRRERAAFPVLAAAAASLLCAFALTWATNPVARLGGLDWLGEAVDVAREFPWDGPIRTAGQDVRSLDLPWWYVPAWLGAQLPLLTAVALVAGFFSLAAVLVRRRRTLGAETVVPLVPIGLQAIGLPLAILSSGAVLYDGIRHLLFALPALIALPAIALALAERRNGGLGERLGVALPLAAVVVVTASLLASARWAPYAYAFVNPAAGYDRDGRDWELDYWGVSAREGIERLRELGYTSIYLQPAAQPGIAWGAVDADLQPGEGAALYVFLRWSRATDWGCEVLFTVKRDGHVLGEGARCPGG